MAHLLDSSVWIALYLDLDTQHKKAGQLFEELQGTIYVPYCVASEVATVLAYKHSKEQANSFLEFIENTRGIMLLEDSLREESAFYKSVASKVSFTDVALLFLSRRLGAKLITFDKQLEQIDKKLG